MQNIILKKWYIGNSLFRNKRFALNTHVVFFRFSFHATSEVKRFVTDRLSETWWYLGFGSAMKKCFARYFFIFLPNFWHKWWYFFIVENGKSAAKLSLTNISNVLIWLGVKGALPKAHKGRPLCLPTSYISLTKKKLCSCFRTWYVPSKSAEKKIAKNFAKQVFTHNHL